MSNGLKFGGLSLESMSDYGFGDGKGCQAWWMRWLVDVCNFHKIPHGGLGFNGEA